MVIREEMRPERRRKGSQKEGKRGSDQNSGAGLKEGLVV